MDKVKPILTQVKEFFGFPTLADFKVDWQLLSDTDRDQIKAGIADGSLTY